MATSLITYTDPLRQLTRAQWARWENVGLEPDLDLDRLVLNWPDKRVADLEAKGALTGLSMDRTIEGASTVALTLRDPEGLIFSRRAKRTREKVDPSTRAMKAAYKREPVAVDQGWDPLLPPDVIGRAMEVQLDGVVFRLVAVRYSGSNQELELTFEDRLAYWLKRKRGAKRASRANVTRAQFILALLREVGAVSYRYVCPELNTRQPVDKAKAPSSGVRGALGGTSQSGDVPSALTRTYPAHRMGTANAPRLSERMVRLACELAGMKPTDALHMSQISHGESNYYPGVVQDDPGDGNVGHGLFQMTPHAWGPAGNPTARQMEKLGGLEAMRCPIQAARMAKWMFDQSGLAPWYGTRYLNRASTGRSVVPEGMTADSIGTPEGEGSSKDAEGSWSTKSYQFTRNQDENSWEAMQRMAGEVGWRCFIVGRSLYFMSDADLYGQRPRYEVNPNDPAVLELDYSVDWGKPVSEATLSVALERWGAPPGSVVLLDGWGPPDGRWLVGSVHRDWFSPTAEVSLIQPGKRILEPADTSTQRASNASGGDQVDMDSGSKAERVYAAARAISDKNLPYIWGGGHAHCGTPDGGTGRDSGIGYDCSGYVCACLAAAGLGFQPGAPGAGSGQLMSWGQPGKGRQFTVRANEKHTWIDFHGVGAHDRADTAGGDPRGPHLRDGPGVMAAASRHWPGV